uniref:Solute carrier family 13 member 5 n=1 Tax=Araneus ventricosus TaxID=182803 RepID=A0A4Y2I3M4_ARAVE|nr:Solute carrier family 13 member 5 [Araneus ventricosus]
MNENLNDELSRRPLAIEVLKMDKIFCQGSIKDATPAVAVSLLLFIIPSKPSFTEHSPPLLNWRTAQRKIPWGVLLLLGSGFVVADAAKKSHLSLWLSGQLSYLNFLSPAVICIILTFMASILTEVISNMSMATIMLPVVSEMVTAVSLLSGSG